jgi:hypothetical protein
VNVPLNVIPLSFRAMRKGCTLFSVNIITVTRALPETALPHPA